MESFANGDEDVGSCVSKTGQFNCRGIKAHCVVVQIDNIIIFSNSLTDHLQMLKSFLLNWMVQNLKDNHE